MPGVAVMSVMYSFDWYMLTTRSSFGPQAFSVARPSMRNFFQ